MADKHRLSLPKSTQNKAAILKEMRDLRDADVKWKEGRVFSLVYHHDELKEFIQEAHNIYLAANGLNPTAFSSLRKFEVEVVSMGCGIFKGGEEATGCMTSGGTESIFMAVKAAREWGRKHKPGVERYKIVAPISAHPAFNKAAYYLDMDIVHTAVRDDFRADVDDFAKHIDDSTVLLVGSAPAYPMGVVDPIREMAAIAKEKNLLFHVDSCAGGFVLPFLKQIGYEINDFDFSVPGVTSISADIHKYGYAAKGASLVLYKNKELRKHQFYAYTEWPGGIYVSPAAAGTRPGGPIAAAWAIMKHLGEEGYQEIARETKEIWKRFKTGIEKIDGVKIMGDPDGVILAIGSDEHDIYSIGDEMTIRGYHMDRQQNPESLHMTLTLNHGKIVDAFLKDLEESVAQVKKLSFRKVSLRATKLLVRGVTRALPENWVSKLTAMQSRMGGGDVVPKRSAAMYGMMAELPNRGDLEPMVIDLLDKLFDAKVYVGSDEEMVQREDPDGKTDIETEPAKAE